MTEETAREVRQLVAALVELGADGVRAGADGQLFVDEVIELSYDVVTLGDALRDLATPSDPAKAAARAQAAAAALAFSLNRRRLKRIRRLRETRRVVLG